MPAAPFSLPSPASDRPHARFVVRLRHPDGGAPAVVGRHALSRAHAGGARAGGGGQAGGGRGAARAQGHRRSAGRCGPGAGAAGVPAARLRAVALRRDAVRGDPGSGLHARHAELGGGLSAARLPAPAPPERALSRHAAHRRGDARRRARHRRDRFPAGRGAVHGAAHHGRDRRAGDGDEPELQPVVHRHHLPHLRRVRRLYRHLHGTPCDLPARPQRARFERQQPPRR